MSGQDGDKEGSQMRTFWLVVGALIFLGLGSLEVIAAHNLPVTEKLSAPEPGPWK
jgi:uncharacterized membrane protein